MAFRLKGWHIFAIATIAFLLWYGGYLSFTFTIPSNIQPPGQTDNLVSVTKPLKIALNDPLGGSAIASATVQIYGSDRVLKESLTTDSAGVATSALPYASGDTVYVKIAKPGYVTRWYPITVPKMAPADAQSLTTNFIALQTYNLGTYTIKVTDQFGNSYTSGGTLNFTALGTSTMTLTITIYNTEDNSGYISSYDRLNNINLGAVLLTSTAGSSVTVSGAGSSVVRGTSTYWITPISDDSLTRQLVGNQYVKPGVASASITFGKGSLASTQAFTFNLMDYFDSGYFAQNGIGGPDAASLASFSLTLAV